MTRTIQALSDPTRRAILRQLREGDRTAGELAEQFDLAKSTLSGHFNVLRAAGLVVSERHGTRVVYTLQASVLEDALLELADMLPPGSALLSDPLRTRLEGSK